MRAQIRCQPGQLVLHLVPFDRHRGALHRDHRAVGHRRTARLVGGCQLDVTRRDQVLRDDDRLGVGRNRDAVVDVHGHLGLRALQARMDSMVPDLHPGYRTSSPG